MTGFTEAGRILCGILDAQRRIIDGLFLELCGRCRPEELAELPELTEIRETARRLEALTDGGQDGHGLHHAGGA